MNRVKKTSGILEFVLLVGKLLVFYRNTATL